MTSSLKTLVASSAFVLAASIAFTAMAQTPSAPVTPTPSARPHGKGMKELDTNKDKMISRDEAKTRPRLAKNFDAIDTNKDGQLSHDEIKAYRKAHQGERKSGGQTQPKP